MAHITDNASISSNTLTVALEGGGPHLEPLKVTRTKIRAAAKKLCADYACFSVMDPQVWEDADCDLEVFEQVQEVINALMIICMATTSWAQEVDFHSILDFHRIEPESVEKSI